MYDIFCNNFYFPSFFDNQEKRDIYYLYTSPSDKTKTWEDPTEISSIVLNGNVTLQGFTE